MWHHRHHLVPRIFPIFGKFGRCTFGMPGSCRFGMPGSCRLGMPGRPGRPGKPGPGPMPKPDESLGKMVDIQDGAPSRVRVHFPNKNG